MTVALVNMPFAPATRPSIQLGILRALLDEEGIPAREFHAAMHFYDRLRQAGALSQYTAESPAMVSEWFFSSRPLPPDVDMPPTAPLAADDADALALAWLDLHGRATGFPLPRMLAIRRDIVPSFVETCVDEIIACEPRAVCFTLSYAQLNASFAVARRLKQRRPEMVTIFGGAGSQVFEAACRQYMQAFAAIDVMVLGEAERVLAPLIRRLQDAAPLGDVPNLLYREGAVIRKSEGTLAALNLDETPVPRYDGWFEARGQMPMATRRDLEPTLLMELGRGCTWGDERTCKFCAFIFHGRYRSKSRERVLHETQELARRHHRRTFYLVDDIVTNTQITDVVPAMARAVPGLIVTFLEMRTATTRRHVQQLAESGVRLVQPGTENFDDGLLTRISKGTTAFHNIQFLRWARELGVRVSHNILLDVPGGTREEVETQLRVIRLLTHLDPPFCFPLQLVRFSPYHADPTGHGLGPLHPHPFYGALFPDGVAPEHVAYEFVEEGKHDAHADLHQATAEAVRMWQARWGVQPVPYLVWEPWGTGVRILDGRHVGPPRITTLDAQAAAIHGCIAERAMNEEGILRALLPQHPMLDLATIRHVLDDLTAADVALHLRGRWLSLAVDAAPVRAQFSLPEVDGATPPARDDTNATADSMVPSVSGGHP